MQAFSTAPCLHALPYLFLTKAHFSTKSHPPPGQEIAKKPTTFSFFLFFFLSRLEKDTPFRKRCFLGGKGRARQSSARVPGAWLGKGRAGWVPAPACSPQPGVLCKAPAAQAVHPGGSCDSWMRSAFSRRSINIPLMGCGGLLVDASLWPVKPLEGGVL